MVMPFVSAAISVTLLPIALAVFGTALDKYSFWPRSTTTDSRLRSGWARFVLKTNGSSAIVGMIVLIALALPGLRIRQLSQQHCGASHPRAETKGLAPALERMLFDKEERRRRKMEGTPGCPNQPMGLSETSADQVEWEQFNLRKVDDRDPLRELDRASAEAARRRSAVAGGARSPPGGAALRQP